MALLSLLHVPFLSPACASHRHARGTRPDNTSVKLPSYIRHKVVTLQAKSMRRIECTQTLRTHRLHPTTGKEVRMKTVLAMVLPIFFASAVFARDDTVVCRHFAAIPVALASGEPASSTVSGELCATEDELRAGTTVQLLIHGATYNHDYWDFGRVDGIEYSYARDVATHGFPTF